MRYPVEVLFLLYRKIPNAIQYIGKKILVISSCLERIDANYSAFFPNYDYVSMTP